MQIFGKLAFPKLNKWVQRTFANCKNDGDQQYTCTYMYIYIQITHRCYYIMFMCLLLYVICIAIFCANLNISYMQIQACLMCRY